jgi:hypothetical protein
MINTLRRASAEDPPTGWSPSSVRVIIDYCNLNENGMSELYRMGFRHVSFLRQMRANSPYGWILSHRISMELSSDSANGEVNGSSGQLK